MSEATTIRVSKKTAEALERLRERTKAESLDEAIQLLIGNRRNTVFEKSLGVDRDKVKPFSEEDRGENRD